MADEIENIEFGSAEEAKEQRQRESALSKLEEPKYENVKSKQHPFLKGIDLAMKAGHSVTESAISSTAKGIELTGRVYGKYSRWQDERAIQQAKRLQVQSSIASSRASIAASRARLDLLQSRQYAPVGKGNALTRVERRQMPQRGYGGYNFGYMGDGGMLFGRRIGASLENGPKVGEAFFRRLDAKRRR